MKIAHITFDYPDAIDANKTKAVFNLVNTQELKENYIFSLNRTINPFADFSPFISGNVISMRIYGWPYGLGLTIWMYLAAKKIGKIIKDNRLQIDLIHAHKVTFEGLIARKLSQISKYPFIVTFRGDTDTKLFKYKYFSKFQFKKVLDEARNVIVLAPWTFKVLAKVWKQDNKSVLIPNIIELSDNMKEYVKLKDTFISVFHLNSYKRKNIIRVINALDNLHQNYPNLKLDIIGGGDDSNIRKIINSCKYPENFNLVGKLEHKDVLNMYSKYAAFILPSYPETFGMVFIEALNAGIPVIYAKDSGIDGYFEKNLIGEKVTYDNTKEIADAILKVYTSNNEYVDSIIELKEENKFSKFSSTDVGIKYKFLLTEALKK